MSGLHPGNVFSLQTAFTTVSQPILTIAPKTYTEEVGLLQFKDETTKARNSEQLQSYRARALRAGPGLCGLASPSGNFRAQVPLCYNVLKRKHVTILLGVGWHSLLSEVHV